MKTIIAILLSIFVVVEAAHLNYHAQNPQKFDKNFWTLYSITIRNIFPHGASEILMYSAARLRLASSALCYTVPNCGNSEV